MAFTRSGFHSGRVDSRFENNLWRFITVYEDIGENFNPEVGFIERSGIHQYFGQLAWKPRPRFIPHVRQMEFETQIEYYTDRHNKLATRQTELSWDTVFKNSSEFFFRPIDPVNDVLTAPFAAAMRAYAGPWRSGRSVNALLPFQFGTVVLNTGSPPTFCNGQ